MQEGIKSGRKRTEDMNRPTLIVSLDYELFWGMQEVLPLEAYQEKPGRQILAYIHGHTHGEHIYRGSSFPIISVGCNKCEYFPDKKPEGCSAYQRKPDTVTQDLWDILHMTI